MSSLNRRRGKECERWFAKDLGGKRVGILGYEDIELALVSLEIKERKNGRLCPADLRHAYNQAKANSDGKIPIVILHQLYRRHEKSMVYMNCVDCGNMANKSGIVPPYTYLKEPNQDIISMRYIDWRKMYVKFKEAP